MLRTPERDGFAEGILARAEPTLALMHGWGYVPTVESLAASLLGGRVSPEDLLAAVDRSDRIRAEGDFVFLEGGRFLLERSRRRVESDRALNDEARGIASAFARDLVRSCPSVDTVALAGSVASHGYRSGDDIDFDLFVREGTKYIAYLGAVLLGLRYSWRYRHRVAQGTMRTPLLPKVACINVVWPEDQARPFVRQDEALAFELLRCEPLVGAAQFRDVLRANPWVRTYFPQIQERAWADDGTPPPNGIGGLLQSLEAHPRALRIVEWTARRIAWVLYSFVQWTRHGDSEAVARMEFLRRAKHPYEVFQDGGG